VGSTSLGESLDPEDLYDLESQIQGRVEESVRRYGGHVAKRLGDGVMALFGAPTAYEDDAERAVLAGLDVQHALDALNAKKRDDLPPLQMRVGITSGVVVAGDLAGTYDVIGDAANVAARLQGAAEVGGVLVGEETMRLARRRVRFGARQKLFLKGKAEPVAAYAALGVREQVGERWEREGTAHTTPLVGREQELETIESPWKRARAGEGQLLTIVGEPGVGKSRLVAEVMAGIMAEAAGPHRVLRSRCLSYGQSVSLWLVADLLRSLCSLTEDAGREAVEARITATVEEILAGRDVIERGIARDVLGDVLGLPPGHSLVAQAGPQIRRNSLIRTLALVLGALPETGPVVLILEDVTLWPIIQTVLTAKVQSRFAAKGHRVARR
jgi:class 3 adenylate cyclase